MLALNVIKIQRDMHQSPEGGLRQLHLFSFSIFIDAFKKKKKYKNQLATGNGEKFQEKMKSLYFTYRLPRIKNYQYN